MIVPPETTLIAVQSDGDADALDGLSGWHDRSRIGLVASRAGVAAGCTIVVDGQGADAGIGWTTAGALTTGADEIHTRFSRTMRTVAVALTGAVGTDVERTHIDIIGGRLATERDGTTRRPAVVTLATTSVLVYDVVPDRGADAMTVAVTPGSDWSVTAVLGAGGPNEPRVAATELAERLARRGIEAQTAQLTVMQGPGCTVTWQVADAPRSAPSSRRPAKKAPAKKVAAKKAPAKKAASQEGTGQESSSQAGGDEEDGTGSPDERTEDDVIIEEGKFLLYSHIAPALKAGDYRFEVSQAMTAKKGTQNIDAGAVPIEPLQTHVTVTAPRYQLPPDQVLSTYPPAGTEGAYGSRLPQIVIKRRTLPWERGLRIPDGRGGQTDVAETTPWLALVLIAEGEAELKLNQDVGKCVSSDVHLDGEQDVAKGNCLVVRQSILEKILPSRKDVPLLAHARQVDIHDTELMMGDDDGFLSVVISNRLPVAGVDAHGNPAPVKYLACLINLEGQFHRLIPEAPPPFDHLQLFTDVHLSVVPPAVYDHVVSGGLEQNWNTGATASSAQIHIAAPHGDALGDAPLADGPRAAGVAIERNLVESAGPAMQAYTAAKGGWTQESKRDIYETMADGFRTEIATAIDPKYTFPCLLHWSFVSTGSTTFETLMRELDSGLSGSLPQDPPPPATHKRIPPTGREPLEVVETGHVGLVQRTAPR